jgi:hypothetical protein
MKELYQKVAIETLNNGAVLERINHELNKVVKNICDPNTSAKAPREIILKIKLVPTEDRQSAAISTSCASKLVSGESLVGRIYLEAGSAFEPRTAIEASLFDGVIITDDEENELNNKPQKRRKELSVC